MIASSTFLLIAFGTATTESNVKFPLVAQTPTQKPVVYHDFQVKTEVSVYSTGTMHVKWQLPPSGVGVRINSIEPAPLAASVRDGVLYLEFPVTAQSSDWRQNKSQQILMKGEFAYPALIPTQDVFSGRLDTSASWKESVGRMGTHDSQDARLVQEGERLLARTRVITAGSRSTEEIMERLAKAAPTLFAYDDSNITPGLRSDGRYYGICTGLANAAHAVIADAHRQANLSEPRVVLMNGSVITGRPKIPRGVRLNTDRIKIGEGISGGHMVLLVASGSATWIVSNGSFVKNARGLAPSNSALFPTISGPRGFEQVVPSGQRLSGAGGFFFPEVLATRPAR